MTENELRSVYYLHREISLWEQRLKELECRSVVGVPEITGMPSGGGGVKNRIETDCIKLDELRAKIQSLQNKLIKAECEVLNYIDGIDDSFVRQIIYLRCVRLKTWSAVAAAVGGGNTSDSVRKAYKRFLKKNGRG